MTAAETHRKKCTRRKLGDRKKNRDGSAFSTRGALGARVKHAKKDGHPRTSDARHPRRVRNRNKRSTEFDRKSKHMQQKRTLVTRATMYSITISSMSRTVAGDGGIESPNPNIIPRTTRRRGNVKAAREDKRPQQRPQMCSSDGREGKRPTQSPTSATPMQNSIRVQSQEPRNGKNRGSERC